jgi:hypothetical protein
MFVAAPSVNLPWRGWDCATPLGHAPNLDTTYFSFTLAFRSVFVVTLTLRLLCTCPVIAMMDGLQGLSTPDYGARLSVGPDRAFIRFQRGERQ